MVVPSPHWLPLLLVPLCAALTLTLSAAIVWRYIDWHEQPRYLTVTLVLSLSLPISIVFLLPVDLISAFCDVYNLDLARTALYLNSKTVSVLWQVNYWLTFLLTWVLLPFLQYWFDSGYYKRQDRFKESVLSLLKFQLLMLVACLAGLVYIVIYHSSLLSFSWLKSLVITASHIYALTLALWLMAHGLVHMPRSCYEAAGHYDAQLHKAYLRVPQLKEKMEDSRFELTELCAKICSISNLDPPIEYRDWCLSLLNDVPTEFRPENQRYSYQLASEDPLQSSDLNSATLHDLSLRLHRLRWSYNHSLISFKSAVETVIRLEDEVNSRYLGELKYRKPAGHIWQTNNSQLNYALANYVVPGLLLLVALAFLALSVIVLESEVLHGLKVSLVHVFTDKLTQPPSDAKVASLLLVLMPILGYMLACALVSLFMVKIFEIYHIDSNHSSDPVSLIFFISYACRLTIPLCYNFLTLLDAEFALQSAFQKFLGDSIKLISLGNFLNDMLPRLILIPICFTLFRVWDKIKLKMKGNIVFDYFFDEFDFYSDDNDAAAAAANDGNERGFSSSSSSPEGRDASLVREAKQIVQQYVNDAAYSSSLRTFNIERQGLDLESPEEPRESLMSRITDQLEAFASRFKSSSRKYNIISGGSGHISLGGESRSSSASGISLNTNYDSDNSIIQDSQIPTE